MTKSTLLARHSSPARSWKLTWPQRPKYGLISQGSMSISFANSVGHLVVRGEVVRLAAHRPAGLQRRHAGSGPDRVRAGSPGCRPTGRCSAARRTGRSPRPRDGCRVRTSGSSTSVSPFGSSIGVRCVTSSDSVPTRTSTPVCRRIRTRRATLVQVEQVARVVLGHQQQVARVRAHPLDRVAGGLHGGRQHLVGQVVEAAREQVHVDRRQLVAGVAQVDRAVERRRVVQPLQPEPALDRRQRVEDALLEIQQGAGLGGQKVGNGGKRHFELACGARADPPRAGAIGTGSLACTLGGRIGVSTRVLGGRGGAWEWARAVMKGETAGSGWEGAVRRSQPEGRSRGARGRGSAVWARAAASGARPGLIRGGRRVAPTSLCCSARSLPRNSRRALRALCSDSRGKSDTKRAGARRLRSCAARRPGNRTVRAPLAAALLHARDGFPLPAWRGGAGEGCQSPPARREAGWVPLPLQIRSSARPLRSSAD